MKRSTGIHPACLNALRGSQSEVISVVNCLTHEEFKELAPLETMTETFTECGELQEIPVVLSSGKMCLGANLRYWFCSSSLADSGYAEEMVFH